MSDQHNSVVKTSLLKMKNAFAPVTMQYLSLINLICTYTNTLALTHSNPMLEY